MKIVICEDERYWSKAIETSISIWASTRKMDISCQSFAAPQEIIDHLTVHTDIDTLFLDTTLGEKVIDGITLAKHIRKIGSTIPIIFVTMNPARAIDGYLVEAVGFLTKPIDNSRLALFMNLIIQRQRGKKTIKLMVEGHRINIYQKDIIYVEVVDHRVTYYTTQGNFHLRETFSTALLTLGDEHVVRIHRSYAVALDKISSIKTTYPYSVTVTLLKNNQSVTLPVSRKYIHDLLKVYSDDVLGQTDQKSVY